MTVPHSLWQVTASDAELVLRVRQGDLEAYGELMRRYRPRFGRYVVHLLGDEDAAERVGIDHPADADAWRDEITRALAQLVPEQREAFLLKYAEGLSYEEMEDLTGAGTSALKMRVKRACERLRELLQGVYDG